jgi:hypothetical protein
MRPLVQADTRPLRGSATSFCMLHWRIAQVRSTKPGFHAQMPTERPVLGPAVMAYLAGVAWDACLRALRRAGFVVAAESHRAVVLARAGHSVLMHRAPVLDDETMQDIFRSTALSRDEFVALLSEDAGSTPLRPPRASPFR